MYIYIYIRIYEKRSPFPAFSKKKGFDVFHTFPVGGKRRGLRQHFLAAAKVFETPQFAELRLGNRAETGWFCGTVLTDP